MAFINRMNAVVPPLIYQPPLQYLNDGTDIDLVAFMYGACNPTSLTAVCGGMEFL